MSYAELTPTTYDQLVIWCDLNAEQKAIETALDDLGVSYSSVHGGLTTEEAERRIEQWRNRETVALIGKPVMLGQGLNLQQALGRWGQEYLEAEERAQDMPSLFDLEAS